jgi:hypothetical protein
MKRDEVLPLRDGPWVAVAMESWGRSRRLALRGRTPSPRLLRALFEESVAVQQTAWTDDRQPAGLFQVTDVSERDGTGLLHLLVDPRHAEPLGDELAGFLAEAFEAHPLRKLCLWAAADELAVPDFLGVRAHQVGRLAAHDRRGPGEHADMLIYEIWKEAGA